MADEIGWMRLWWLKRRHLTPRWWDGLLLHREFARRRAFAKGRILGEALQMFREGRLTVGEHAQFEHDVWFTGTGRIDIGSQVFVNRGVMIAAVDRVTIGDHVMIGNGCTITDANHDHALDRPLTQQGYSSKGPVSIGAHTLIFTNVVITSGVTIGERCVIGANSTVTRDVPPFSMVAGSPARVIRRFDT